MTRTLGGLLFVAAALSVAPSLKAQTGPCTVSSTQGELGLYYSVTCTVNGGFGFAPTTFAIGGTAPTGLQLASFVSGEAADYDIFTVTLGGIPTVSGSFNFSIEELVAQGAPSVIQTFSLTIPPPTFTCMPAAGSSALGPVEVGAPYAATCTLANVSLTTTTINESAGSATFSLIPLTSNTAPPWLSVNPAAAGTGTTTTVSGTPTASGSFNYAVEVNWVLPQLQTFAFNPVGVRQTLALAQPRKLLATVGCGATCLYVPFTPIIAPGLSFTSCVPSSPAVALVPWSVTCAWSGGAAPYSYAVTQGGGIVAARTGTTQAQILTLTGTPTVPGPSGAFTISLTDADGVAIPLTIPQVTVFPAIQLTCPSAAATEVGVAFATTCVATGATGSYVYSVGSGALPVWLSLNQTTGRISGTPPASAAGQSFSFTIQVHDAQNTQAIASAGPVSGTVQYAPVVTTTALPTGQVGSIYSTTLVASYGAGPQYIWKLTGSLPPGLSLSPGGVISGTPTTVTGSPFSFIVQATDTAGQTTSPQTLAIVISFIGSPLQITTMSPLPTGIVGVPYGPVTLAAAGGTGSYVWSTTTGFPPNLTLSSGGILTGTPNSPGTTTVNVTVKDSAGNSAPGAFSLTISPPQTVSLGCTPSTATLAVGAAYTASCTVSGGAGAFTFSASPLGSLPVWLSLNQATGVVTGTPTAAGTYSFAIQASQGNQTLVSPTVSITVTQPGSTLQITTQSPLSAGVEGMAYAPVTFMASGGTAPYTWTAPVLPPGLMLSGAILSGTPTAVVTSTVTITVTDSAGHSAPGTFSLTINSPPPAQISTFTVVQGTGAAPQNTVALGLATPPASQLTGTLSLTFSLDSSVTNLPSGWFNTGAAFSSVSTCLLGSNTSTTVCTLPFTITPPSTTPVMFANAQFGQGTVAGKITVQVTALKDANGVSVLASAPPSQTVPIPAAPPVITSVQLGAITATGFTVSVSGYSTTRSLTSGTFTFNPPSGAKLNGNTTATVQLSPIDQTQWFTTSDSQLNDGGTFALQVQFYFTGDPAALGTVTVTLTNPMGASAAVTSGT